MKKLIVIIVIMLFGASCTVTDMYCKSAIKQTRCYGKK